MEALDTTEWVPLSEVLNPVTQPLREALTEALQQAHTIRVTPRLYLGTCSCCHDVQ